MCEQNHAQQQALRIYAAEKMSAVKIDKDKTNVNSRRFYGWGTRDMIDSVSKSAQTQGCETGQHRQGSYARGGSSNQKGIFTIDHKREG